MSNANGSHRAVFVEALRTVDYGDEHIEFDWPYLDHDALANGRIPDAPPRLDLVTFHNERRHDWSTSAVVCDFRSPEAVGNAEVGSQRSRNLFEATAAPTVVLANHRVADLWIRCWGTPHQIEGIGLDRANLCRAFSDYRDEIERQALARFRGGQQYLFDRVYDARREQLAAFLHVGLDQAARKLHRQFTKEGKQDREQAEERLSHVAMALLAARIFEDKDFFGRNRQQSRDARRLLAQAESETNGFFKHVIAHDLAALDGRIGRDVVDEMLPVLMAHLTGPACFSLITPEMLGDLYERALVANGRRGGKVNLKGIHYTPLSLANHILRRIPIEELPPSRRFVADLACGSGSFLLAATARLREAFDANECDAEDTVFEHLRNRVLGNDLDDIALQVTRMRYLLTHWIENRTPHNVPTPRLLDRDGLDLSISDFGRTAPTLVVGNPPFHPSGGDQMANRFLRKAIELVAPDGFLGMIMPAGFLKMRKYHCPETRRQLLQHFEMLEVWELPQGSVGLASRHAPCVVIARRRDTPTSPAHPPVLFKVGHSAQAEAQKAQREQLRSTWTFLASGRSSEGGARWLQDPMSRIFASSIDSVWRKIDLSRTVGELCIVGAGISATNKEARFSAIPQEGYVPYLQHQERLLPFFLTRRDWSEDEKSRGPYVDPNTGLWPKPKLWPLYRGLKVVLRASTNRNARLQTVAAFDCGGVFPDDHFRCLAVLEPRNCPHDWMRQFVQTDTKLSLHLWLTAVFNSPIGHAWIAMTSAPRGLQEEVIRSLPVPQAYDADVAKLVEQTKTVDRPDNIEDPPLWSLWSDRPARDPGPDFQSLAGQINCLLFRSYGLSRDDFELVNKYLEGMTDPWVDGPPDAHIPKHPERRVPGTVVSINVSEQTILLDLQPWSRKAGGPIEAALPKDMPGWALREGMGFTCLAPKSLKDASELRNNPWLLRDFRPLPYSYLEDDELGELVTGSVR
jgi:hypothetical protein